MPVQGSSPTVHSPAAPGDDQPDGSPDAAGGPPLARASAGAAAPSPPRRWPGPVAQAVGRLGFWPAVWGAVAVGFALRLAAGLTDDAPASDETAYLRSGINLVDGAGFTRGGHPELHFPPFVPFVLGLTHKLVGDAHTASVVVTLVAGTAVIVPLVAGGPAGGGASAGHAGRRRRRVGGRRPPRPGHHARHPGHRLGGRLHPHGRGGHVAGPGRGRPGRAAPAWPWPPPRARSSGSPT